MEQRNVVLLSLDGGGARGALTAEFLRLLENDATASIYDTFDLFAGVSTGAIIAAFCASNREDMSFLAERVYSPEHLSKVFDKSSWDRILGRMQNQPVYNGITKAEHFEQLFGETRLDDIRDKRLLVLAYDFINREVAVFKNGKASHNPTLKELIDAATAAPTLYPPVGIRESESRWLIDGAIATNDPSVIAISEALAMGYALENIWVISLGTGHPEHDLSQEQCDAIGNEAKHWGMVEWVANGLFDHMMTGSSSISEYQCRQLLGDRYLRVNDYLPRDLLHLDKTDPETVAGLKEQAGLWFNEHRDSIFDLLGRAGSCKQRERLRCV